MTRIRMNEINPVDRYIEDLLKLARLFGSLSQQIYNHELVLAQDASELEKLYLLEDKRK